MEQLDGGGRAGEAESGQPRFGRAGGPSRAGHRSPGGARPGIGSGARAAAGGAHLGGQRGPDGGRVGDGLGRRHGDSAGRPHRGGVLDDRGERGRERRPGLGQVVVDRDRRGLRMASRSYSGNRGASARAHSRTIAGVVSMWNCSPQASRPRRKAWCSHAGALASRTAPGGRSRIASKCHCSTSGVMGSGPNSGSVEAAAALGHQARTELRTVGQRRRPARRWRPPAVAPPRQTPSVGVSAATAARSRARTSASHG